MKQMADVSRTTVEARIAGYLQSAEKRRIISVAFYIQLNHKARMTVKQVIYNRNKNLEHLLTISLH
jgi:hypothetical protein